MVGVGATAPQFDGSAVVDGHLVQLSWQQVHENKTLVLLFDPIEGASHLPEYLVAVSNAVTRLGEPRAKVGQLRGPERLAAVHQEHIGAADGAERLERARNLCLDVHRAGEAGRQVWRQDDRQIGHEVGSIGCHEWHNRRDGRTRRADAEARVAALTSPDVSLSEFDLGKRYLTILSENGLNVVGDFLKKLEEGGDEALLEIPGIGRKVLADLKKTLRARGYDLPKAEAAE